MHNVLITWIREWIIFIYRATWAVIKIL